MEVISYYSIIDRHSKVEITKDKYNMVMKEGIATEDILLSMNFNESIKVQN